MSVSTVPTFKAALQAQLQGRSGLTGVDVSYGIPRKQHREWIWLADIENHTRIPATARAGGPSFTEEYDLLCVIRTEKSGRSQQDSDERFYELVAEIESQLRADPQVNGTLGAASGWAQVKDIPAMQPAVSNDGVSSKGLLTIHVKARI